MKKIILTFLFLIIFSFGIFSQIGINTLTPNSKSALDINSTSKGLLPPRMTEAQRFAIASPIPAGLMIWCTDCGSTGQMQVFNGNIWTDMVGVTAAPGPFVCGISTVTFTYNGSPVTYGTVVSAGGKCWLDRNLGASQVATSSTDAASYGDLFQWGRGNDGHQIRNPQPGTTTNMSGSDSPGHGNFIIAPNHPYDWRSPQNINLWQGVNGINNPCPTGFRVPTSEELDAESLNWTGTFSTPLKLPMAGFCELLDGLLYDAGSDGNYWSNTVYDINSRHLHLEIDDSAGITFEYRAYGFSVRCIKD